MRMVCESLDEDHFYMPQTLQIDIGVLSTETSAAIAL